MTKAEKFRNLALKTVLKFTDGMYSLKNVAEASYVPSTGESEVTYVPHVGIPMVRTEIEEDRKIDNISSDKHFSVTVAGLSVEGFEPKLGSVIVTPEGDEHRVVAIASDLYSAAFEMFVHKDKWE